LFGRDLASEKLESRISSFVLNLPRYCRMNPLPGKALLPEIRRNRRLPATGLAGYARGAKMEQDEIRELI